MVLFIFLSLSGSQTHEPILGPLPTPGNTFGEPSTLQQGNIETPLPIFSVSLTLLGSA